MTLSAAVTNHTTPASAQSQAYTGVGFQPKALIALWAYGTALGNAIRASLGIGAAGGTSDFRSVFHYSEDNVSPSSTLYVQDASSFYRIYNIGGGVANLEETGTLTALGADGFTINHSTVTTGNRPFSAISLGGADLTNVKTGVFHIGTATGALAVTGVGFQPDCVIFFTAGASTADPAVAAVANTSGGIGWASSTSARGCCATRIKSGVNPTVSRRIQLTNRVYAILSDAGSQGEGDLQSFDSDGFTINRTVAGAADYFVYFIALKGGSYKAGSFNSITTTGAQAVTGVGFQPRIVLLLSANQASSSSNNAHARRSFGAFSGSSNRWAGWFGDQDAVATENNNHRTSTSQCITMATEGTPTVTDEASPTSLDSDGFTINWGTNSGSAKEILYLAIGDAGQGGAQDTPELFPARMLISVP